MAFLGSIAASHLWLPYWTAQIWDISITAVSSNELDCCKVLTLFIFWVLFLIHLKSSNEWRGKRWRSIKQWKLSIGQLQFDGRRMSQKGTGYFQTKPFLARQYHCHWRPNTAPYQTLGQLWFFTIWQENSRQRNGHGAGDENKKL